MSNIRIIAHLKQSRHLNASLCPSIFRIYLGLYPNFIYVLTEGNLSIFLLAVLNNNGNHDDFKFIDSIQELRESSMKTNLFIPFIFESPFPCIPTFKTKSQFTVETLTFVP